MACLEMEIIKHVCDLGSIANRSSMYAQTELCMGHESWVIDLSKISLFICTAPMSTFPPSRPTTFIFRMTDNVQLSKLLSNLTTRNEE